MNLIEKYLEEVRIEDIQKADMKKWLTSAFDMYNNLMEHMTKINVRDSDISKEWKKVDKAFDSIIKISNRKGYFK